MFGTTPSIHTVAGCEGIAAERKHCFNHILLNNYKKIIFFSCDYFTDSFKAHIRCYVHETAYRGFQNNIHNFGKFPGEKAPKKLSNEAKLKNKSYFRFLNQGDTYDIDHRQNKVGSL